MVDSNECKKRDREKWNAYQREYYKKHPELIKNKSKRDSLNKRRSAVKRYLIGELKQHREDVLEVITNDKTVSIKARDVKNNVYGGLIYVMVTKREMVFKEALRMLPTNARNPGRRPYISVCRAYRKIKRAMENDKPIC